jgi:hypothetical protein
MFRRSPLGGGKFVTKTFKILRRRARLVLLFAELLALLESEGLVCFTDKAECLWCCDRRFWWVLTRKVE